jgi:hypothetical protein
MIPQDFEFYLRETNNITINFFPLQLAVRDHPQVYLATTRK